MAEGNLLSTIADANWRLVQGPTDPANGVAGDMLAREVRHIAANSVATLRATELSASPITNPVADGTTYAGLFVVSDLIDIKEQSGAQEGAVTLRETLTKVTSVAAEGDLPTPVPLKGQDINYAFALESVTEDMVAYEYLYLNPANQDAVVGMSVAVPVGYTEVQRRAVIEPRGDRTLTLKILWQKVTCTNVYAVNPNLELEGPIPVTTTIVGANSADIDDKATIKTCWGVPPSDASSALTAWSTEAGVENVELNDTRTGETIITIRSKEVGTVDNWCVTELGFDAKLGISGFWTGVHLYWPSLSKAVADTMMTDMFVARTVTIIIPDWSIPATTFNIKTISNKPKPDGTYRIDVWGENPIYVSLIGASDGDIDVWKQNLETRNGTIYRVTLGRRVTSDRTSAMTWANLSPATMPANAHNNGDVAGMRGGGVVWQDQERRFIAWKETWTAATTYSETP